VTVQRHRQRHGGRPQQHGDRRGALAIVRIFHADQRQRRDHQQHADHHRLQHQPAAAPIQHQRQLEGNQRKHHGKQRMRQHVTPGQTPVEHAHA